VRSRNSCETIELAAVLRGIVCHREHEIAGRGADVRLSTIPPATVFVDAPLLFNLLTTLLDWALASARSEIDLRIDVLPTKARLVCQFAHPPLDALGIDLSVAGDPIHLDSLHWRLLQQTAQAMELPVALMVASGNAELTLEFPRTAAAAESRRALRIDENLPAALSNRLVAGNHVLVVAQHHEVRVQVADALSSLGLIVDFGMSVDEAVDFCRDGLPHAIIVESGLCRDRFTELRHDIAAEAPRFVFVEIIEDHRHLDMTGLNHTGMAHVEGDAIASSLPSALMLELARGRAASASTRPAPLGR
jgi:CheY-like chemotaxis protein